VFIVEISAYHDDDKVWVEERVERDSKPLGYLNNMG
jgi:hypothetical protein